MSRPPTWWSWRFVTSKLFLPQVWGVFEPGEVDSSSSFKSYWLKESPDYDEGAQKLGKRVRTTNDREKWKIRKKDRERRRGWCRGERVSSVLHQRGPAWNKTSLDQRVWSLGFYGVPKELGFYGVPKELGFLNKQSELQRDKYCDLYLHLFGLSESSRSDLAAIWAASGILVQAFYGHYGLLRVSNGKAKQIRVQLV